MEGDGSLVLGEIGGAPTAERPEPTCAVCLRSGGDEFAYSATSAARTVPLGARTASPAAEMRSHPTCLSSSCVVSQLPFHESYGEGSGNDNSATE